MQTRASAHRYRLYGRLTTGSAASEAALAETGARHTLLDVPGDRTAAAAGGYLAINPRGQVPALVLPDGTVLTEGAAILLHLADAFPEARLAPPPGTAARATHDRWLFFFHANVYEGELRRYYPDRYTTDPAGAEGVRAAAEDYVKRHYLLFDRARTEAGLADAPFALGPRRTALDLYLWMLIQWIDRAWMTAHAARLLAVADAVAALPAVAPVHARHFAATP